ncbi:MAG: hypothetical protein AAB553_02755 [Patescibacteria group bacterium]
MITLPYKRSFLFIIFLTVIGTFLHFYNLNWGAPFYFHPDERNIASAVAQLSFPDQMNPNFFAYGSLPLYVIYFTGYLLQLFMQFFDKQITTYNPTFEQAVIISRFYSAMFATLLIPILYLVGKKMSSSRHSGEQGDARISNKGLFKRFWTSQNDENTGLFTAFFATMSVGFIQFAHFGTFEMWLTFFSILLFWLCLQKVTRKTVLLAGIIFGTLIAVKISSLVLIILPLLWISIGTYKKTSRVKSLLHIIKSLLLLLIIAFLVYAVSNPYIFFDTPGFLGSMRYESGVGLGTTAVFYTQAFMGTIPVLFQFISVYPFLLNPLVTILFVPVVFFFTWKTFQTKRNAHIMLLLFFIILFVSQAFLFVKWTRYMVPTLPFVYLILSIILLPWMKKLKYFVGISIIVTTILFTLSYFIVAYIQQDTRLQAQKFVEQHIPQGSHILSETYDIGILPIQYSQPLMTQYDFYELDNNSFEYTPQTLTEALELADYIVFPSHRVIQSRLSNPKVFPHGHTFYTNVLNETAGFTKIYETPCDLFCKITYLGNPIQAYEQTANVFDRPTVFIFQKSY